MHSVRMSRPWTLGRCAALVAILPRLASEPDQPPPRSCAHRGMQGIFLAAQMPQRPCNCPHCAVAAPLPPPPSISATGVAEAGRAALLYPPPPSQPGSAVGWGGWGAPHACNELRVPDTAMHRGPLVRRWKEIYRCWAVNSSLLGGLP